MSQDTHDHIKKVQARLDEVTSNLTIRAAHHDMSKLAEPELSGYAGLSAKLSELVYGSDEYRAALAEAKPVIDHHYAANDHHPEHYPEGIAGMSLLSLLEMICDWKAASERTKQGSIERSLEVNAKRWNIDPQLASIIANTVKEMGW